MVIFTDPVCKEYIKMPYWYYDKKDLLNTPSFKDGIENETESRYRKEGARFIIDTGTKMDLGYNTMATGVVYFHRFYMFHSFRTFPRYVTACCCLFLAGKVEETPKKCKDIIKIAKTLLTDAKFATFGEDPKEEVMMLEKILLKTIKFDLQVEHPYSYLLKYAKCLKGDKAKLQKMVQMAWTFVNDSLCTTLSLQWEPEVIAVALMFLAGKLSKFEVVDWNGRLPKHKAWWDMFVEDVTLELLEDICHQVLDLYSTQSTQSSGGDSPPLPPPTLKPTSVEKKAPTVSPPQSATAGQSMPAGPTVPTGQSVPAGQSVPVVTKPVNINTPVKNGSERVEMKPDAVQQLKTLVGTEALRFPFPPNNFPGLPPHHTLAFPPPPMMPSTLPPPLLSIPPRPPVVFSEPPPTHYPPPVTVPPPNYFPPPQSRPYFPPPA